MEKRLITAIALSILVIVAFQYFIVKPTPPTVETARTPSLATKEAPKSPPIDERVGELANKEYAEEEKTIELQNERYIITFSNIGGSIKAIRLKDYKNSNSDEPLELVSLGDPKDYIFALNGQIGSQSVNSYSVYEAIQNADSITYSTKTGEAEIVKKYILHNSNYGIELQLIIKNKSKEPKTFNANILSGAGLIETDPRDKGFIELSADIDGNILPLKKPKEGRILKPGPVKWIASKSKYFSLILKPFVNTKGLFYSFKGGEYFAAGLDLDETNIPPDYFIEQKFILYAGPSKTSILKEFGHEFDRTVKYGVFDWIAKAMIALTIFFYRLVHNWGFSIILLAICLNIVLFPLSMKSFKSMKKMQELHPQMEKLKSQYKDNPQKLNKEIMELYKKYKVNPFSGCLPLLLQMPIFIALYQALSRSIELKHASFLWIRDLSLPDALPTPFSMPILGNSVNLLPLFMVVAMLFQQRMSTKAMGGAVTEEQKQQQKMMLFMMPIMFGFIFYNMPSGLVLYWLISTVLTTVEQSMLLKNI